MTMWICFYILVTRFYSHRIYNRKLKAKICLSLDLKAMMIKLNRISGFLCSSCALVATSAAISDCFQRWGESRDNWASFFHFFFHFFSFNLVGGFEIFGDVNPESIPLCDSNKGWSVWNNDICSTSTRLVIADMHVITRTNAGFNLRRWLINKNIKPKDWLIIIINIFYQI